MENQNDSANDRHRCSKRFRDAGSKKNGDLRLRQSHASDRNMHATPHERTTVSEGH